MRRTTLLASLWLSACTGGPGGKAPEQPSPSETTREQGSAPVGCGLPANVLFATREAPGDSPPGEGRWRLPLGHVLPGADPPAPGPVDRDALARWDIDPIPDRVWMYFDDEAPCL